MIKLVQAVYHNVIYYQDSALIVFNLTANPVQQQLALFVVKDLCWQAEVVCLVQMGYVVKKDIMELIAINATPYVMIVSHLICVLNA